MAIGDGEEFQLVGFKNFVRTNPRSDRFAVRRFHHIDFWCGDAPIARSDLSTGNAFFASTVLRSGDLVFAFTAPYSPTVSADAASLCPLPSFSAAAGNRFFASHGLGVRAVGLLVEDAAHAYAVSVAAGARSASPPADIAGATVSEVELYGDVVLRFVSTQPDFARPFLPGYEAVEPEVRLDYGLNRLDHAVGNVPNLAEAVRYVAGFTGFHEFAEFTAADVGTAESGLNSVVLVNNDETILLPINEPVFGTKRRSSDIFKTVREMRKRSAIGGFELMPPAPPTYYRNLKNRAGDVLSDLQIRECGELGILVDRDDEGVLLQIFTKPVGDRQDSFIFACIYSVIKGKKFIQKDEQGKEYQKGGCGGFGKGNISELFKSIEDYEKTLECNGRGCLVLKERGIYVCLTRGCDCIERCVQNSFFA
ncbi:unnamed protein product [Victoria cruziana]